MTRRRCLVQVVLLMALAIVCPATAQSFPDRPVRIVVGQGPGSAQDRVARMVGERLSDFWGQAVVIENRAGAGGTIAAELVAKSPADGYTLLLGGQSNLVVAPALDATLRYNALSDFAPIGRAVHAPLFVVMNARHALKNIPELVAYAKARPGQLTFVTYGDATVSSFAFELLAAATGIDMVQIPYKTSASALGDLLAGRVDLALYSYAEIRGHVDAGSIHVLGGIGAKRAAVAPTVPTIVEQGVAGYAIEPWYGILAPAGIPDEVQANLTNAMRQIRQTPEMQKRVQQLGYEPLYDDPAQFAAAIRADIATIARVAARKGIAPDRKAPGASR